MVFGDGLVAPASADPAVWIRGACGGRWGTVGALVPNGFECYARVSSPDSELDDWRDAYRSLYSLIGAFGAHHTTTPEAAWFAVWEGYGWETSTSLVATSERLNWFARRGLKAELDRLRHEDRRRHLTLRSALATVPRFELPHRSYYLVRGTVGAVADVREPGAAERWQRPDLFWPDDRAWFVASDVDFWSVYVGGATRFIDALTAAAPTTTEIVSPESALVPEP